MRKITITPKEVVRLRVVLRDFNRMLLRRAESGELIPWWLADQGVSLCSDYMEALRDYALFCRREKRAREHEIEREKRKK